MTHILSYALRRTPPAQKALRAILEKQRVLNDRVEWSADPLGLAPLQVDPLRSSLVLPFLRLPQDGRVLQRLGSESPENRIPDAIASGRSKVNRVWDAHLVAAFLRWMSDLHSVCFELRDESGFVIPGAVLIRNGRTELQREWLNRERERILEVTGNPEAAAPYLLAEAEAVHGRFFQEGDIGDFPADIAGQLEWEELEARPMSHVALEVVKKLTLEPVASRA